MKYGITVDLQGTLFLFLSWTRARFSFFAGKPLCLGRFRGGCFWQSLKSQIFSIRVSAFRQKNTKTSLLKVNEKSLHFIRQERWFYRNVVNAIMITKTFFRIESRQLQSADFKFALLLLLIEFNLLQLFWTCLKVFGLIEAGSSLISTLALKIHLFTFWPIILINLWLGV